MGTSLSVTNAAETNQTRNSFADQPVTPSGGGKPSTLFIVALVGELNA